MSTTRRAAKKAKDKYWTLRAPPKAATVYLFAGIGRLSVGMDISNGITATRIYLTPAESRRLAAELVKRSPAPRRKGRR